MKRFGLIVGVSLMLVPTAVAVYYLATKPNTKDEFLTSVVCDPNTIRTYVSMYPVFGPNGGVSMVPTTMVTCDYVTITKVNPNYKPEK